jgi:hypothetical protein
VADTENDEVENDDLEDESEDDSQDDGEFDAKRAKEKINKTNREAQNLRTRLKELEKQNKEYQDWKDSQKSDHEKDKERAEAAEKRIAELELSALRTEVALAKGLTAAQAKRLQGATKEELEQDADELIETFGDPQKSNSRKGTGFKGGSDPNKKPDTFDAKALAERLRNSR